MIKIAQNAHDKVSSKVIKFYSTDKEYIACEFCSTYNVSKAILIQQNDYFVNTEPSYNETQLLKVTDVKIRYIDPYENVLHVNEHMFVIYNIDELHKFDYLSCLLDGRYQQTLWKTIGPFSLQMKFKDFIKNKKVQHILQHMNDYNVLIIELNDREMYIST